MSAVGSNNTGIRRYGRLELIVIILQAAGPPLRFGRSDVQEPLRLKPKVGILVFEPGHTAEGNIPLKGLMIYIYQYTLGQHANVYQKK